MKNNVPILDKDTDTAEAWGRKEFEKDSAFWLKAQKNENGLMRDFAVFVVRSGQGRP